MLLLDRYADMHFFTSDGGGNAMMFINLIWTWGHPEVYILVIPAFGVFSEVIATFSGKPLFGYRSMVIATMGITILAFTTWLHHFFTMGSGADVNAFFGITTMVISIPTGVKIFNWLFTMYGGRVRFTSPVLWTIGFMFTFTIGGMTGVLMAVPPVDFVLHNSLFLVAHFHNVIIGGVVFGCMAGLTYWFPKAFGFTLDETLGKAVFWCWFVGFWLAFTPLYALGFLGMPRRMNHYDDPAWTPYLYVAVAGAALIMLGIFLQIVQLVVSIRTRHLRRDLTGDPWDGRTLEWATVPAPPPAYNFAVLPNVDGVDAWWAGAPLGQAGRAGLRSRTSRCPSRPRWDSSRPSSRSRAASAWSGTSTGWARDRCSRRSRTGSGCPGTRTTRRSFPPGKSMTSSVPHACAPPAPERNCRCKHTSSRTVAPAKRRAIPIAAA